MRLQPAETIDTSQADDAERPHDERAGSVKLQAVLDRALQLPESLRLGFLLRELNGETKGKA